jgi:hypothetical protein
MIQPKCREAMRVTGKLNTTTYLSAMPTNAATPALLALNRSSCGNADKASANALPPARRRLSTAVPCLFIPAKEPELWFQIASLYHDLLGAPCTPSQQSKASSSPPKKQDRWFQLAALHLDPIVPHFGSINNRVMPLPVFKKRRTYNWTTVQTSNISGQTPERSGQPWVGLVQKWFYF